MNSSASPSTRAFRSSSSTSTPAPAAGFVPVGPVSLSVSQLAWGPLAWSAARVPPGSLAAAGTPARGVWLLPTVRLGRTCSLRSVNTSCTVSSWATKKSWTLGSNSSSSGRTRSGSCRTLASSCLAKVMTSPKSKAHFSQVTASSIAAPMATKAASTACAAVRMSSHAAWRTAITPSARVMAISMTASAMLTKTSPTALTPSRMPCQTSPHQSSASSKIPPLAVIAARRARSWSALV